MDSDDETFDDFHDSQEVDVGICGKKNSSFEALTTTDIADLMNQYIDDVKSIAQVSFTVAGLFHRLNEYEKLNSRKHFLNSTLTVAADHNSYFTQLYKMG